MSKIKIAISKKSKLLMFFGMIFLGGILIWLNFSIEKEKLLTEKKLLSATKLGEVTRLKEIAEFNQQFVCTLAPYQGSVSNEYPYADRINQHLRSVNYLADEGHWSLVFVDDKNIAIVTLKRNPDLLGIHDLDDQTKLGMPANFEPSKWANIEQAAFYRVSIKERQYLIMGKFYEGHEGQGTWGQVDCPS